MAGTKLFVEQYGQMSFDEFPFCDGDAVAFCEISYMPLDKAVSADLNKEPIAFSKMADDVFKYCGNRHIKQGLMINMDVSRRLMQMADTKRYGDIKVLSVLKKYSFSPAVQFCAASYLLPDNTLVICFEGTDDTVAGWKEDIDMLIHKGSPALQTALDYVDDVTSKYDGDIILLGHSKGGQEALYVALNCSAEIRNRIRLLYNNDGPGFYSDKFFKTGAYDELGDRYKHYVPYSSFIGMIMYHDNDYVAVDSTKHLGPLQHDLSTWKIKNGDLERVEDIDFLAKVTDLFLSKLVSKVPESLYNDVDKVFTEVIKGAGQETLTQFTKNVIPAIKGAKLAWKSVEPDVKKNFSIAFKGAGGLLKDSVKAVKNKAKETVEKVAVSV